jgi:hypothetical protein
VLRRIPAAADAAEKSGTTFSAGHTNRPSSTPSYDILNQDLRAKGAAGPAGPQRHSGSQAATAGRSPTRADCAARLGPTGRVPPALVLTGNAVAHGRPVYVIVFRSAGGYDVYVVSPGDCAVVGHTTVS